MATGRYNKVLYAHHPDGYSLLSSLQQNTHEHVKPHVVAVARSLNENRQNKSFVVVDYGAADGLNSVPMIAKCAGELSVEVSEMEWIFNDIVNVDNSANIKKIEEELKQLLGWREGSVKLQFAVGSFYTQVVPDDSVDMGVSVNAVHWMSHRPPNGCSADPYLPDEATKSISAKDWVDFLQCRAKELKRGGKLIVEIISTRDPQIATKKECIIHAPRRIFTDMFNDGVITKEEYEFARVFPFSMRTKADVQAPFLDPESDLGLHVVDIKTFDIPCPFYDKWMKAGGRQSTSATEEFVTDHVNYTKSFYNSFWKILEVTRTREVHLGILEEFYLRVEQMVRGNLEGYHCGTSVYVVELRKV